MYRIITGAAIAATLLLAPVANAQNFVGVSKANKFVTFSAADTRDAGAVEVKGFGDGETVVGIDQRPLNGLLYALTSAGNLYTVDLAAGQATPATSDFGDPIAPITLVGAAFGFDFNPAADMNRNALRIVSDAQQNLRQRFVAGGPLVVDGPLSSTGVVAAAYTNPDQDPNTGTTLFDLDADDDRLKKQDPPNAGGLVDVGPVGFDVGPTTGFDVASGAATGFATGEGAHGRQVLYAINLADGATTTVGTIGGPKGIRALAALR